LIINTFAVGVCIYRTQKSCIELILSHHLPTQ